MNGRAVLLASALALPLSLSGVRLGSSLTAPLEGPRRAEASVAVLISLDELVQSSTFVVTATAAERKSQWEELPSGRRIVTYTRLVVDQALAGKPGAEVWVRTLGGAVGKIGQAVSGEAKINEGSRGLFFLTKAGDAVVVTGLAQGHFPLVTDDKGAVRLASSPDAGTLIPRRGPVISARELLLGASLEDARTQIKRVTDAKK